MRCRITIVRMSRLLWWGISSSRLGDFLKSDLQNNHQHDTRPRRRRFRGHALFEAAAVRDKGPGAALGRGASTGPTGTRPPLIVGPPQFPPAELPPLTPIERTRSDYSQIDAAMAVRILIVAAHKRPSICWGSHKRHVGLTAHRTRFAALDVGARCRRSVAASTTSA